MSNKVKICGVKTLEVAQAAQNAGADFLGFVFYPKSPRNIAPSETKIFADIITPKVAVVVDADDTLLQEIIDNLNPDYIQLHGNESTERAEEISKKFDLPLIRACEPDSYPDSELYKNLLIDSSNGQGKTFNWDNFTPPEGEYFLSGGLNPENIAQAMKKTGATMFDVSSGIERERGVKDISLIKEFISKVKNNG